MSTYGQPFIAPLGVPQPSGPYLGLLGGLFGMGPAGLSALAAQQQALLTQQQAAILQQQQLGFYLLQLQIQLLQALAVRSVDPRTYAHREDTEQQTETSHTPDLSNYVVGWRVWTLGTDDIRSYTDAAIHWPIKRPFQATCDHTSSSCVPNKHCRCGIYAMRTPTTELVAAGKSGWYDSNGHRPRHVIGQVALWGRVIKHTNGYRGQYAYPIRFYLQDKRSWLAKLQRKPIHGLKMLQHYGVPIVIVKKLSLQMLAEEENRADRRA